MKTVEIEVLREIPAIATHEGKVLAPARPGDRIRVLFALAEELEIGGYARIVRREKK